MLRMLRFNMIICIMNELEIAKTFSFLFSYVSSAYKISHIRYDESPVLVSGGAQIRTSRNIAQW